MLRRRDDTSKALVVIVRGVVVSLEEETETGYVVEYDSPHYGKLIGEISKDKAQRGALGTIVDVGRAATVVAGQRATLFRIHEPTETPEPGLDVRRPLAEEWLTPLESISAARRLFNLFWNRLSILQKRRTQCRQVFPTYRKKKSYCTFVLKRPVPCVCVWLFLSTATVPTATELRVLRRGPPKFTLNGPGSPSCWEVETTTEPRTRGFIFDLVRRPGGGAPVHVIDVCLTKEVSVALDADVKCAQEQRDESLLVHIADVDDENVVLGASVRECLVSKADGDPTSSAFEILAELLRKPRSQWSRSDTLFVERTMHETGQWHETNTTLKYTAANASKAKWLSDLLSDYRLTQGRIEYLASTADVRQTEEELAPLVEGIYAEVTNDFMCAMALRLGWGAAAEKLLGELAQTPHTDDDDTSNVTRVSFSREEKTHLDKTFKYGTIRWEAGEDGFLVVDMGFDAAHVAAFVLDESCLSPNYKFIIDFLLQMDIFQAKRDAVALDQWSVYNVYCRGSMHLASGCKSHGYAERIYPDSVINEARRSEFDTVLQSTVCFSMEGKSKNMTPDQLVEKINMWLKGRFPQWSKGIEVAVRNYTSKHAARYLLYLVGLSLSLSRAIIFSRLKIHMKIFSVCVCCSFGSLQMLVRYSSQATFWPTLLSRRRRCARTVPGSRSRASAA